MVRVIAFLLAISISYTAQAGTLFEGYSRIISGGVHVGFVVQRYEYDEGKKEFYSTYYMETNQLGGGITESLKARANEKLEPLHYRYTRLQGDNTTIVEGNFQNGKMTVSKTVNGQSQQSQVDLPNGAFLGTFLTYVMLKSPQGMKEGLKYNYQAIAEEDGTIASGLALIKSEAIYQGVPVYRIINEFKGAKYVFFVTPKGETLATKSPVHSISTELAASSVDATKGFALNAESLKILFGAVPIGKINPVSEATKAPTGQ